MRYYALQQNCFALLCFADVVIGVGGLGYSTGRAVLKLHDKKVQRPFVPMDRNLSMGFIVCNL